MKAWFKRNWKWVVFPVGILLLILPVLGWLMGKDPKDDDPGTTTDAAADTAVKDIFEAQDDKEDALVTLEKENKVKLSAMTTEQNAEYERIKKSPVEDVASWIDKL